MTTYLQQTQDRAGTRARWAATGVFFLNGLMMASFIVRIPSLKVEHDLSTTQLGVTSTLFGGAAVLAMQFIGGLAARHGSRRLIRIGLIAMPLALVGVGLTTGFAGLAVAALLLGAVNGTLDVSMNSHAVAVERRLGRPLMSGCHAAWSVSAVTGSLIGTALIKAGVPLLPHFVGIAVLVLLGGAAIGVALLPSSADRRRPAAEVRRSTGWRDGWTRALVLLGLTGMAVMICEGAALAWAGVYLHSRGASLTLASVAVLAFTACQTAVRLVGDRLTTRFGPAVLFRAGAIVAAGGLGLAVLSPDLALAVCGFATVGLGTALLLPLTFSAAGHAGAAGPGAAVFVARFTTFTYAGILLGPSLIGWAADGMGLQWTLGLLVPLLCVVARMGVPSLDPVPE